MHLDLVGSIVSSHTPLAISTLGGGLIYTAIIGIVTGIIAKFLSGDREPTGCLITMVIGIVGAYLALFIGQAIGLYQAGQSPGLISSVIGAIILLAIYHFVTRRTGGPKI